MSKNKIKSNLLPSDPGAATLRIYEIFEPYFLPVKDQTSALINVPGLAEFTLAMYLPHEKITGQISKDEGHVFILGLTKLIQLDVKGDDSDEFNDAHADLIENHVNSSRKHGVVCSFPGHTIAICLYENEIPQLSQL